MQIILQWFDEEESELVKLPYDYSEKLSEYEKLMVLRCFRVDRVYRGIVNYISNIMGEQYITPPNISFNIIYDQSTSTMPVVFILSPGSDPISELMNLAEKCGFKGERFKYLSLGQGQEKVNLNYLFGKFLINYHLIIIYSKTFFFLFYRQH